MLHTISHASRERRVAVGLRSILDRGRHVRNAVGLLECDGDNRWFTPHGTDQITRIDDLGMHESRVRNDFQDLASESELLAVLVTALAPAILTEHAHIHLAASHAPTGVA